MGPLPAPAILVFLEMVECAVTLMNVLDHINVHLMLHVQTQLALIPVPVILGTKEMVEVAVTEMNVLMDLTDVHLLPHASITLAHTVVSAILDLLEMEENVHARQDLLKVEESAMTLMNVVDPIYVLLMPHVTTHLAHTFVYAILASLVMEEAVLVQLDLLKVGESAMT